MSRVVYTSTADTAEQVALRSAHQVRIVADAEEGTGVDALPGGVYGFTYAPGLPNAPLFAVRRYRSFETHKLAGGEIFVVGFVAAAEARDLSTATDDVTLQVHPEPEASHDVLVTIPYSRIRRHKRYASPNQQGLTVTVMSSSGRHQS